MNSKEYFKNQIKDFEKSTIIAPNSNKDTEKIIKTRLEIDKKDINMFCKINLIAFNNLFLSSVILTLHKFNTSNEILIFYDENIPFVSKIENDNITVKDFLNQTNERINLNNEYKNYPIRPLLKEYGLKPEFYYSFNEPLRNPSEITCTNFLNINDDNEQIILTFFYNNQFYSEKYVEMFLKSIKQILSQIVHCELDKIQIKNMTIEKIEK